MAFIKYINRLTDFSAADITRMELAASIHKQSDNIEFKIVTYDHEKVIIQVVQGKNLTGVYHSLKRLIEIVHEIFDRFFPDKKVLVHPIPFNDSPVNKVTINWINKQLQETNTKLKHIERETGISKIALHDILSGKTALSQEVKAFFYYYFLSKL